MTDIKSAITSLPFWNILSYEEKTLVGQECEIKKLAKGQIVNGCEKNCLGIFLIIDGEVRIFVRDADGVGQREATIVTLYNGDVSVMSASCAIEQITFETEVMAEKESEILLINTALCKRIMQKNLKLKCFVYELLIDRFSSAMNNIQQILFMSYDKRLAIYLTEKYLYTGSKEMKITQEEIARATSSAREVVGRSLKKLENEGIISRKRGMLVISDLDALKARI